MNSWSLFFWFMLVSIFIDSSTSPIYERHFENDSAGLLDFFSRMREYNSWFTKGYSEIEDELLCTINYRLRIAESILDDGLKLPSGMFPYCNVPATPVLGILAEISFGGAVLGELNILRCTCFMASKTYDVKTRSKDDIFGVAEIFIPGDERKGHKCFQFDKVEGNDNTFTLTSYWVINYRLDWV